MEARLVEGNILKKIMECLKDLVVRVFFLFVFFV